VPVGSVMVDGSVGRATVFSVADLAALPVHSLDVSFKTSRGGTQHHVEAGPLLVDVLARVGPRFAGVKSGELRDFVVITGADGYEVVLSYGEIAPTAGNRPAILSLTEDGVALAAPRLAIPGDVMGGRDVSQVVHVELGSAPPGRP
jgi:hypothetical protein